jgi:hypothetical protein
MQTRILTVGYSPDQTHQQIPYIRLRGKWLAAAGFKPGDRIKVTIDQGTKLTITKTN